ncbi:MAG: hypothetical protein EBS23_00765 [Betaproteobacteria bacterium]|nr:hypothetical protein [Betaproteobacteria bacterium]
MSHAEIRSEEIIAYLQKLGLDYKTAQNLAAQVELATQPQEPRLHSSLSIHEAQDWLAANDPAGADYWRAQQPNVEMIAAVGEQLMLANASRQLVFDREWQERYLRGDIPG